MRSAPASMLAAGLLLLAGHGVVKADDPLLVRNANDAAGTHNLAFTGEVNTTQIRGGRGGYYGGGRGYYGRGYGYGRGYYGYGRGYGYYGRGYYGYGRGFYGYGRYGYPYYRYGYGYRYPYSYGYGYPAYGYFPNYYGSYSAPYYYGNYSPYYYGRGYSDPCYYNGYGPISSNGGAPAVNGSAAAPVVGNSVVSTNTRGPIRLTQFLNPLPGDSQPNGNPSSPTVPTYPYNGWPPSVVPMPEIGPAPVGDQNRSAVPREGIPVSLPREMSGHVSTLGGGADLTVVGTGVRVSQGTARLAYPAYGDPR